MPIFALTGGLMLLASGLAHLRGRATLTYHIAEHGLLPGRPRAWALLVTAMEIVSGLLYTLALVAPAGFPTSTRLLMLPAVVASLSLAAYALWLRLTKPFVPCGCGPFSSTGEVVNLWTVFRALILLGAVGAGWMGGLSLAEYANSPLEAFLVGAAAIGLALPVLVLPSAMQLHQRVEYTTTA